MNKIEKQELFEFIIEIQQDPNPDSKIRKILQILLELIEETAT